MNTKTILASALVLAMSGAAHAAKTTDGTPATVDGKNAGAAERSEGTSKSPVHNKDMTTDGTTSTADGEKAAMAARDYEKSVEYYKYRATESPYNVRASDILGADVVNAKNEEIGEVDDVIFSRSDKKLHAVIEVGGFLGIGEKLVTVPLDELRMDGHGNVYLNVSEDMLKKHEKFAYNDGEMMGYEQAGMRVNSAKKLTSK
jgi:sporulation protein YlmC with PRC-barrel domain